MYILWRVSIHAKTCDNIGSRQGHKNEIKKYKVLHEIAGKSMIEHVVNNVQQSGVNQLITIVGHGAESVKETLGNQSLYSYQDQQLGTAHAVKMAEEHLRSNEGTTLVVCGDTPLITAETLKSLIEQHESSQSKATVLTATANDPKGYGRVIKDNEGQLLRIVEEKTLTTKKKQLLKLVQVSLHLIIKPYLKN